MLYKIELTGAEKILHLLHLLHFGQDSSNQLCEKGLLYEKLNEFDVHLQNTENSLQVVYFVEFVSLIGSI